MIQVRALGLKWLMAILYLAVCFSVLLLLPSFFWPFLLGPYVIYCGWRYWTLESAYGRSEPLRPLTRWDVPDYDAFLDKLQEACQAAGLKQEPVWTVVDEDEPNAIALGGWRGGIVVFTRALLRQHPQEELVAIAGHELSHLASRDNLPALLGASWLSMLTWIAATLADVRMDRRSPLGLIRVIGLLLDMVVMIVGWIAYPLLAKRSRSAEHLADLTGARVASAGAMIAALERLETQDGARHRVEAPRWSPRWISEQLHRSHPPTPARVAFLRAAVERGEVNA